MKAKTLLAVTILGLVSMSADAALYSRLGGQAYYDDVLNVTWMANANLGATNTFGVSGISTDLGTEGRMTWNTAQSWIAAMNSANYLGVSTWRLPHMIDIGNDGCLDNFARQNTDCGYNAISVGPNASEMASMYYATLGNHSPWSPSPISGIAGGPINYAYFGIQNVGPFTGLSTNNNIFWYDLETTSNYPGPDLATPDNAWYFGPPSGGQRVIDKTVLNAAWVNMSGDIAVVPVPGAVWLFGSALGLLGWSRRKAQ